MEGKIITLQLKLYNVGQYLGTQHPRPQNHRGAHSFSGFLQSVYAVGALNLPLGSIETFHEYKNSPKHHLKRFNRIKFLG